MTLSGFSRSCKRYIILQTISLKFFPVLIHVKLKHTQCYLVLLSFTTEKIISYIGIFPLSFSWHFFQKKIKCFWPLVKILITSYFHNVVFKHCFQFVTSLIEKLQFNQRTCQLFNRQFFTCFRKFQNFIRH